MKREKGSNDNNQGAACTRPGRKASLNKARTSYMNVGQYRSTMQRNDLR